MITKVNNTISFLKNLWVETFMNKTNRVSDVTENSVLSGVAYASAKVAQKCLKDVAIVETQIFPETASGEWLDRSAKLFGVAARRGALGSSTYVCVFATPGTAYIRGTHIFSNINGIRFTIEEDTVVGPYGYAYVPVRSETAGSITNVTPNSILSVAPIPQGHIACTNEYYAIGGRDEEDDDTFRRRILNAQNFYSQSTLEKFTQVFQQIDNRILKIMFVGLTEDGYYHIQIISQNGQFFTKEELANILDRAAPYFGVSDLGIDGSLVGVKLDNAEWYLVGGERGLDFRCEIDPSYDLATVRKNIQINLTKYLDWRNWVAGKKVEWDDLFEIIKRTGGVRYLSSDFFYPNKDEVVPTYMLPRFRRFIMRDLDGSVLIDSSAGVTVEQRYNELFPAYYSTTKIL